MSRIFNARENAFPPGIPTSGVIQKINAEKDVNFIASDEGRFFYLASNITHGWPGQVGRSVEFDLQYDNQFRAFATHIRVGALVGDKEAQLQHARSKAVEDGIEAYVKRKAGFVESQVDAQAALRWEASSVESRVRTGKGKGASKAKGKQCELFTFLIFYVLFKLI